MGGIELQNRTTLLGQTLSLVSNCIGPPCEIVYPSDAVSEDLQYAMGPELWKYGFVSMTNKNKACEEAYVILNKEVDNNGNSLLSTNIFTYVPTLDMIIGMGEGNLPLKAKVLSSDTLSPDQKWGTFISLQSAHSQSISTGE